MAPRIAACLGAWLLIGADSPPPPSLAWMHGDWSGSGTFQGQPGKAALSIAPVLGGSATAMTYRAVTASFSFEGRATYRINSKGRVEGQWNDSAGSFHQIGGRIDGKAMTTVWGSPATEIGRSTYSLKPDGTLETSDAALRPDGSWHVFATMRYSKDR